MNRLIFLVLLQFSLPLSASPLSGWLETSYGLEPITYELSDQIPIIEGDILLPKANNKRPGAVIVKGQTRLWENGIIPYTIDETLPIENKLNVLRAMIEWLNNTSVRFVNIKEQKSRQYTDYIRFIPANGTECSSYVGKKGGMQVIRLAKRCNVFNTTHEIGHALGLWHEQSRGDRDNFITIVWENIDHEMMHNFEQHLHDGQDIGEYDYDSLMHYGPYAFSKNGQPTIIPTQEGAEIGQRTHLSTKDVTAINSLYPIPAKKNRL